MDGNTLGEVEQVGSAWAYYLRGEVWSIGPYATQKAAVFALVADEACPDEGPNRFDKGEKR